VAGLAVTGRVCGIGQNVLKYYFPREQKKPQLLPHFFLIAFFEEAFIENII
jgi:hypothetical protein